MTRFSCCFVWWFLPGLLCAAETIPVTHGTSLAGADFVLPRDLAAGHSILILGFSQKSAVQTGAWSNKLRSSVCLERQRATCYNLPVLGAVPRILRGIVLRSIKEGTPEPLRRYFLPIFEKEPQWKRITQFWEADDAYILVVNRAGDVEWRTNGDCTTKQLENLKKATGDPLLPGQASFGMSYGGTSTHRPCAARISTRNPAMQRPIGAVVVAVMQRVPSSR